MSTSSRKISRSILQYLQTNPNMTLKQLTAELELENPVDIEQLRRQARYLKRRSYVYGSGRSGYSITAWGRQRLEELQFGSLEQKGPWDHTWRIVIFDIPESKRQIRDSLRRLIQQLGFQKLQNSVWVHPLPCLEEFRKLRDAHGLRDNLILLEAKSIEDEHRLLLLFERQYPNLLEK